MNDFLCNILVVAGKQSFFSSTEIMYKALALSHQTKDHFHKLKSICQYQVVAHHSILPYKKSAAKCDIFMLQTWFLRPQLAVKLSSQFVSGYETVLQNACIATSKTRQTVQALDWTLERAQNTVMFSGFGKLAIFSQ